MSKRIIPSVRASLALTVLILFGSSCDSIQERQIVGKLWINEKLFHERNEQMREKPAYLLLRDEKLGQKWIYPGPKVIAFHATSSGGTLTISGLNNAPEATIKFNRAEIKGAEEFVVRAVDSGQSFDIRGRRSLITLKRSKIHHDFHPCAVSSRTGERYWETHEYRYDYAIEFQIPGFAEPYAKLADGRGQEKVDVTFEDGDCL